MAIRDTLARLLGVKASIIPLAADEIPDRPLEKTFDDGTLLSTYQDDTWPYVFANKIGEQGAQARLRAGRLTAKEEFEPVPPGHPVQDLLDNPNAEQDGGEFIHLLLIYMELAGHNPIEIVRPAPGARIGARGRRGQQSRAGFELLFLPGGPRWWKIVPGANRTIAGYLYERDQVRVGFLPERMTYVRWPNPNDPWYGQGRIAAARQPLMAEEYAAIRDKRFEKNLGVPPGILTSDLPIGDTQAEELRKRWERSVGGTLNAGRIAVLGGGAKYEAVQMSARDAQWLEQRRHRVEEIAAAFGVPMPLVLMQDAKFANAAEARAEFWEGTLQPRLDLLARKLTRALVPLITTEPLVLRFDYSTVEALSENDLEAAQTAGEWAKTGATSVDEVRQRLGLPPHADKSFGQRLIVPTTLSLQDPKEVVANAALGMEAAQASIDATRNPPPRPGAGEGGSSDDGDPPRRRSRDAGPQDRKADDPAREAALAPIRASYERDLSSYFKAQRGALNGAFKALSSEEAELIIERALEIITAKRFRDRLIRISEGPISTALTLGATEAARTLGVSVSFAIPASEAALSRVTSHLERLGTGIQNTTVSDVRRVLTEALREGVSNDVTRSRLDELFGGYDDWRLDRISRTESTAAYNLGALGQYKDAGVQTVIVSDGDTDAPCAAANGATWTLEQAEADPIAHVNCTRTWIPQIG